MIRVLGGGLGRMIGVLYVGSGSRWKKGWFDRATTTSLGRLSRYPQVLRLKCSGAKAGMVQADDRPSSHPPPRPQRRWGQYVITHCPRHRTYRVKRYGIPVMIFMQREERDMGLVQKRSSMRYGREKRVDRGIGEIVKYNTISLRKPGPIADCLSAEL